MSLDTAQTAQTSDGEGASWFDSFEAEVVDDAQSAWADARAVLATTGNPTLSPDAASDVAADAKTGLDVAAIVATSTGNPLYALPAAGAEKLAGDDEKAGAIVDQQEKQAADTADKAGKLLKFISNPWVLGGVAVLIGLAVLAPYASPILRRI